MSTWRRAWCPPPEVHLQERIHAVLHPSAALPSGGRSEDRNIVKRPTSPQDARHRQIYMFMPYATYAVLVFRPGVAAAVRSSTSAMNMSWCTLTMHVTTWENVEGTTVEGFDRNGVFSISFSLGIGTKTCTWYTSIDQYVSENAWGLTWPCECQVSMRIQLSVLNYSRDRSFDDVTSIKGSCW